MRWLITGGLGFIGQNLIKHIHENDPNAQIRILDNCKTSCSDGKGIVAELWLWDTRDANIALKLTEGVDVVVHLAAHTGVIPSISNPVFDCENNVMGTINYLKAAVDSGCKMFIFASSGAVLGEQDPPMKEDCVPNPISPYGASKLAGETYCKVFDFLFDINVVALRFSNVYGPESSKKNSIIPKFIKQALDGEPLKIYGDGNQTRDFIYVDDLCAAILKIAELQPKEVIFQLASGKEVSVNEVSSMITENVGELTGLEVTTEHTEEVAGEVRRNYADISRIKKLGWSPTTKLEEGIKETVRWFVEEA